MSGPIRTGPTKPGADIDRPTPVARATPEADAVLRIAALMSADWYGWIEYVWPIDPDVVDPSRLEYAYLLPGDVIGENIADYRRWAAAEVLPMIYGIALANGKSEEFAYRPDLPGAPAPGSAPGPAR